MSAYVGQAYRYNFTTDWDISGDDASLIIRAVDPTGTATTWTPTITGTYAAHVDIAEGVLVAGTYHLVGWWQPTSDDDWSPCPPVIVKVLPLKATRT